MVQQFWLLVTLALLTATSGCIGADSAPHPIAEAGDSGTGAAAAVVAAEPVEPAESPGCAPHGNNNYATMVHVGDDQVYLYTVGAHWYRESNGVQGIQTESMCPENPDTKIIDVALL